MSQLEVYDTKGNQLYPDGDGMTYPKYPDWANRVYFDLDTVEADDSRVVVTIYARFRIDGEERPTFVRYETDADADLRHELGGIVKRALVQDANWELVDSGAGDDPGFLFPNLIWTDDPRHPRRLSETNRSLLPEPTSPVLREILDEMDEQFVVRARDFRYAATLIERHWDHVRRIRLTVDPDAASADRLVIHLDERLESAIAISDELETLLERTARRLAEERRAEAFEQLEEGLSRLAGLETPPQEVADRLAAAADDTFGGIRVAGPEDPDYEPRYREAQERVEKLEAELEELEARLRELEEEPDSMLDRFLGS